MFLRQLTDRPTRPLTRITEQWWAVVLFVLTASLLTWQFAIGYNLNISLAAITTTDPFFIARPALNSDSALFLHGGWYMTQGGGDPLR